MKLIILVLKNYGKAQLAPALGGSARAIKLEGHLDLRCRFASGPNHIRRQLGSI
jgi:hypothetical protein